MGHTLAEYPIMLQSPKRIALGSVGRRFGVVAEAIVESCVLLIPILPFTAFIFWEIIHPELA